MPVFQCYVIWVPLLLACFFGLCKSQSSSNAGGSVFSNSQLSYRNSNQSSKSDLTEPGVIVGIIVGVAGVLVVIGVTILLCRIFCCKQSACCSCCKGDETYLEAGTVPIKVPSQDSTPDNKPISTISHSHPANTRQSHASRKTQDTSPNPPQYDDIPQLDWKLNDLTKNKRIWGADLERGSQDSLTSARRSDNAFTLPSNDREIADSQPVSGARRHEKTPVRRKLTYGADNADVSQNGDFIPLEPEKPKKRNTDAPRHGTEFPVPRHKPRKRNVQPSPEDEGVTITERNPSEQEDGREFPLLEYEPRKRSFNPSYSDNISRPWEETRDAGREFKPVEYGYQPPSLQPSYPDHRSRMWEEERRPWENRGTPTTRAPMSMSNSNVSGTVQSMPGRVNLAFKQDSSETTV